MLALPMLKEGHTQPAVLFQLPRSKSESNRLLVAQAIAGPGQLEIQNLSDARDTHLLKAALLKSEGTIDIADAGTAMRFATAFHALNGHHVLLTGTARMQERPIAPLVEALRNLGARIEYLGRPGCPPVRLSGFAPSGIDRLTLDASLSSQYLSALILCSPLLFNPIEVTLTGQAVSLSYARMSLQLMQKLGNKSCEVDGRFILNPTPIRGQVAEVEADWSSAGYAFGLVGLTGRKLLLKGLQQQSLQADAALAVIFNALGVQSAWQPNGYLLVGPGSTCPMEASIDFTNIPDQAQTLAVYAAAKGIRLTLTGVSTLRHKETDRLAALQSELAKVGCSLVELRPDVFRVEGIAQPPEQPIATYHDHRMAMSFAMLSARFPIQIEAPDVVQKSFPHFWQELAKLY